MGNITDDKVEFKLDGEYQRVDRAKIAGIIYYRNGRPNGGSPECPRLARASERKPPKSNLNNNVSALSTPSAGPKLTWPLDDIELRRFLRRQADVPERHRTGLPKWTPLVGLPASATLGRRIRPTAPRQIRLRLGRFSAAQGHASGDADLRPSQTSSPRTFNKGLALRSRTEIVYRLPAGFQRFIAIAGIDPATAPTATCGSQSSATTACSLETEVAGDQPPQPIQLDIAGVKRLKIVVDYGQNLDTGDWLNLCNARIVK